MKLGVDPKVDYAFKRLFGRTENRLLLIDVINAVLAPKRGAEVVEVELLNPFNEKDLEDDKLSIVDVKARDQSGRHYNIEMQMLPDRYFCKRLLYYWGKLHTQQLHEGDPYEELKCTIVIAFVDDPVFPREAAHHHAFTIRDETNRLIFSDDFAAHILEIGKFSKRAGELQSTLDTWLYFLKNAESLETTKLPAELKRPAIERAVRELTMVTQADLDRERYEARLKLQRDELSRLRSAKLDGLEEGLEKGRAEGRAESIVESILVFCQLLRRPKRKEDLAGLSVEELQALHDQLKTDVASALARAQANGNGANK
ncbi:MAG: Rpn family recombination-promoting nuclease/putative transposase [Gemmataceae bacterium]